LGLLGECVCIHCFDCPLVSSFTNETPGYITCYDVTGKFIDIFMVLP
jgi:hypothetical protein